MDKSEKVRFAVNVSLYYFTIITILAALGKIIPNLLFKSVTITSILGFSLPWFVVSLAVILILLGFSNISKKKTGVYNNGDNESSIYLVVGILLIVSGIIDIPTQVFALRMYLDNIQNTIGLSEIEKVRLSKGIYTYIIPIFMYVIQIGIGVYFTLILSKKNNQKKESKQTI